MLRVHMCPYILCLVMFSMRYWTFLYVIVIYVCDNMVMLTDDGHLYRLLKEEKFARTSVLQVQITHG